MKMSAWRKVSVILLAAIPLISWSPSSAKSPVASPEQKAPFRIGKILYEDDFRSGLGEWVPEMQKPGLVSAANGVLDIDVPAGLTLWFRRELHGPVMISYDATVVSAGGPNDRVSDLNCFWMATDPSSPKDIFAHPRDGAFPSYDSLLTYYVGVGGHDNTTTRFRRYIGSQNNRPLLPENDLASSDALLVPNRSQHIRLIADGHIVQFYRDDKRLFELNDPAPYTEGWFAIRTVKSHLQIRNLKIVQLIPSM
jgi:hypothetical protein